MITPLAILQHTPTWVFGVFALLAWLGGRQLRRHALPLSRAVLVPLGMGAWSLYGTLSAFGDRPLALLAWIAAALLAATVVLRRPLPAAASYDPAARRFDLPGCAVPLVLMMGIFATKFAAGVALALHPDLAHDAAFALVAGTLYGGFAGSFLARAMRLWKLVSRQRLPAGATVG